MYWTTLDPEQPGVGRTVTSLAATWEDTEQTLPTLEEIEAAWTDIQQQQQLDALDAEYNPQLDALTLAWATASMEGDTETAAARKADKDAL